MAKCRAQAQHAMVRLSCPPGLQLKKIPPACARGTIGRAPLPPRLCCRPFAAVIASFAAAATFSNTASCEEPSEGDHSGAWDRRVFFKYEKRLREFSTHEKTFEYFSSQIQDGRKCMTASDVLRAVLAVYPPDAAEWNRSGSLAGECAPKVDHVRSLAILFDDLQHVFWPSNMHEVTGSPVLIIATLFADI